MALSSSVCVCMAAAVFPAGSPLLITALPGKAGQAEMTTDQVCGCGCGCGVWARAFLRTRVGAFMVLPEPFGPLAASTTAAMKASVRFGAA
jgi:hypothetical protein